MRQLFFEPDIGFNKATVMATRVNLTYGFDWHACPEFVAVNNFPASNIIVSCVDSLEARKMISKGISLNVNSMQEESNILYWLDIGNSADYGQVILGSNFKVNDKGSCMMLTFDKYFDMEKIKEDPDEPSCSLAESLASQGLFTNRIAASLAANMLWELFRDSYINYHGYFFNLGTGGLSKILI